MENVNNMCFNDIMYKMNQYIMENNPYDFDIESQKKLVDTCLKKYTIEKIQLLGFNKMISDDLCEELNFLDLFDELVSMIPKGKYFDTIRFYTHYILEISGSLQGWSIPWMSDSDQTELEAFFNKEGKWDKLNTPLNEDYVRTFKFVYDVFQNNFMIKESTKKITGKPENK